MGDLASFQNDRQLRKLLGWYPEAKESGTSISKHRLGQSGNRLARREIWLWVMFLISPRAPATPFRDYCERLRSRGVPGRTAIGHVAGKLISVLFRRNPQTSWTAFRLSPTGSGMRWKVSCGGGYAQGPRQLEADDLGRLPPSRGSRPKAARRYRTSR